MQVVSIGSDTFQSPSVGRCVAQRGSALDDLREFAGVTATVSGQANPLVELRDVGGQCNSNSGSGTAVGRVNTAGRGSGTNCQISSVGASTGPLM